MISANAARYFSVVIQSSWVFRLGSKSLHVRYSIARTFGPPENSIWESSCDRANSCCYTLNDVVVLKPAAEGRKKPWQRESRGLCFGWNIGIKMYRKKKKSKTTTTTTREEDKSLTTRVSSRRKRQIYPWKVFGRTCAKLSQYAVSYEMSFLRNSFPLEECSLTAVGQRRKGKKKDLFSDLPAEYRLRA